MAKILIIEDDADIAAIEQDYLALAGHDVVIKADGSAGLQAALTGDFDLLLLDLMLPGVDGFTICKQVREQKKLPILMVSARTGDGLKRLLEVLENMLLSTQQSQLLIPFEEDGPVLQ